MVDYLQKTTIGKFTRHIDRALPGKHTRRLYDNLGRDDSSALIQLRTGKCRLNKYLAAINAADSELCECHYEPETVRHFLFHCNRWNSFRSELRRMAGERWGDLSYFLGGWSG